MILGSINLVSSQRRCERVAKKCSKSDCDQVPSQVFAFDNLMNDSEVLADPATESQTLSSSLSQRFEKCTLDQSCGTRRTSPSSTTPCKKSLEQETDCSSSRSSGYASCSSLTSQTPRLLEDPCPVTIATPDNYSVYIDTSYYSVGLRKQATSNCCNLFSRTTLRTVEQPNGRIHSVVFSLKSDTDYFLATTRAKEVELKIYGDNMPVTKETADERVFLVHESHSGASFIQPLAHKGFYLHHIDAKLSLKKFELHLRPPEEYFFKVIGQEDFDSECCGRIPNILETEDRKQTEASCGHPGHSMTANRDVITPSSHKLCCGDAGFGVCDSNDCHENVSCSVVATAEVRLRRSGSKRAKNGSGKRNSLYNVVAMTGSCFGLGRRERNCQSSKQQQY